ncbi:MAG: hypothetical protein ACPLPP_03660 [Caldisericum exile]
MKKIEKKQTRANLKISVLNPPPRDPYMIITWSVAENEKSNM